MAEEEEATLDGQFVEFAKFFDSHFDSKRSGTTITLYQSDYWMRQANLLDDRKLTMTDTGICFNRFCKSEITFVEWEDFLSELCRMTYMDEKEVRDALTNCGIPGSSAVVVPRYRDFFYHYKPKIKGLVYCNATFDSFLCWPPTPAGDVATQRCPPARLSDTTRQAFRRCGSEGLWLGKRLNESDHIGWTNYTPCFPREVQNLFVKVSNDENDAQLKFEIAQRTRYLEIFGFSISLIALLLSMFIFTHFRSLRNNRTRIHLNLFCAMTVQVLIRLTVYIDQEFIRSTMGDHSIDSQVRGIDNMPYICETSYILLEYAISCMFMWMFIEGLYLHNVVTANVFQEQISHKMYCLFGWGLPVIVTAFWATITAFYYQTEDVKRCWYGYNFLSEYWIMQAPRLSVILINLVFLLNIMRVLILKLRRSENTEVEKVRKAVRAALVLLPLLGITNILSMTEAPLDGQVWKFALWCYVIHFLRSFQGFFIAFIYCFMNGEVRQVLGKSYHDWEAMRSDSQRLRESRNTRAQSQRETDGERRMSITQRLNPLRWMRRRSTENNENTDIAMHPISERRRMCALPDFLEEVTIKVDADTNVTDNV